MDVDFEGMATPRDLEEYAEKIAAHALKNWRSLVSNFFIERAWDDISSIDYYSTRIVARSAAITAVLSTHRLLLHRWVAAAEAAQ